MPLEFSSNPEPVASAAPASAPKPKRRNSGRSITHLATRVFNVPLAIKQSKGDVILRVLGPRLGIAAESLPVVSMDEDEYEPDRDDLGYSVENGIAMIPIHGVLVKRASGMDALSGMQSYEDLTRQIRGAIADPEVKGIVFDVDSPGGEAAGMGQLADLIYSCRGVKPTIAVSNDSMYSAAYGLGSAADKVYTTRDGGVGSIGCYMLHCDQSQYDKDLGVKYTYVFAGDHKVDGNPHEPLSKTALDDLKAEVNYCRDVFVTQVARNRNCTAQQILDLQARCLTMGSTPGPIPLLADKVGTLEDAVRDMTAQIGSIPDDGDDDPDCDPDDPDCPDRDDLFGTKTSAAADTITLPKADAVILSEAEIGAIVEREVKETLVSEELPAVSEFLSKVPGALDIQSLFAQAATKGSAGWVDAITKDALDTDPVLAVRCFGLATVLIDTATLEPVDKYALSRTIRSCVAPYNQLSADLGGFKEVYLPGCFQKSLADGDDARAVFNHDSKYVLGRRSAGTAKFYETPLGMHFEVEAPATSWADDLLTSMRRKDITGASAAFFIIKAHWEMRDKFKVRVIEEAQLVEGSVASFPIYETTTASVIVPDQSVAASTYVHEVTELDRAQLELLALR